MITCLDNLTKRRQRVLIFCIFILGVVVHFCFANFVKAINIYADELRYYSIARSILQNGKVLIRGIPSDFQKIAYSIVLSPLFAIENSRIRAMGIPLMNCILMMSSIFPLCLISDELELKPKTKIIFIALFALWPDFMLTATYMSENLYWPVFLLFVYLWLKMTRDNSALTPVIAGLVCYIGYLTKEIFVAFLLAAVIFELTYPVINGLFDKSEYGKLKIIYDKKKFIRLAMFVATFLVCFFLAKLTIFRGMHNSYNQQGIEAICSIYNFTYMLYAVVYYVSAILVAIFILPVTLPILYYRELSTLGKRLFYYTVLVLGVSIATIAYTISVREDLGQLMPRLHFRYLGPALMVLLCVFIHLLQRTSINIKRKHFVGFHIIVVTFVLFFFRGVGWGSCVDEYVLEWIRWLQLRFQTLNPPVDGGITISVGVIIAKFMLVVSVAILLWFILNNKKLFWGALISGYILLAVVDHHFAYLMIRTSYLFNPNMLEEAIEVNDYLRSYPSAVSVLYCTDSFTISGESKAMDTYLNIADKAYYITDTALDAYNANNPLVVNNVSFPASIFEYSYNADTVDFIIFEKNTAVIERKLAGAELVYDGKYYSLYKNTDTSEIKFNDKMICRTFASSLPSTPGVLPNWITCVLTPNTTVFGPYISLEPGSYSICICGNGLSNADFDTWSASQQANFELENIEASDVKLKFDVNLTEEVTDFEVRLTNNSIEQIIYEQLVILRNE